MMMMVFVMMMINAHFSFTVEVLEILTLTNCSGVAKSSRRGGVDQTIGPPGEKLHR